MKKFLFLLACCFLLILPAWLMAQDAVEVPGVDPQKVEAIVVILGGGLVAAVTEMVKRFLARIFKLAGKALGYVTSAIMSIGATGYYLATTGWSFKLFIIYSVLAWMVANGFYKMVAKKGQA